MNAVDTLLVNGTIAGGTGTPAQRVEVGIAGGRIVHLGGRVEATTVVDLAGRLITPALVDCHTHLVFGGTRIGEFARRLEGATYAEIAAGGGGIVSTVAATRAAGDVELFETGARRLRWLMASGAATIEIKSGYGLDPDTELRMLRVARRLGAELPPTVHTSLLAAHAVPAEHRSDPDRYVDQVCSEIIPAAAGEGLADSVDVFCEEIAFTAAQSRRVLDAARQAGLAVRVHADQLSDGGGAALAAEMGALSADHLEHASPEGIEAMAEAGTVAVLLPGASTFLDEPVRPDVAAMRAAGVRMAVASDLNPGTAPLGSTQLAMALACTRFGLTPTEALAGATLHAATALGLDDRGTIEVGKRADLALWDVEDPAALSYWFGAPLLAGLWIDGREVDRTGDLPTGSGAWR